LSVETKRRSCAWYLLPIFLGIVGGVIAYFTIKEDDPKRAKCCIYLGILFTVGPIIVFAVMAAAGKVNVM